VSLPQQNPKQHEIFRQESSPERLTKLWSTVLKITYYDLRKPRAFCFK